MAVPRTATADWTADRVREQLVREDDPRIRYEFVDGEVLVTPSPFPRHQLAVGALHERIAPYVRAHALGRTFVSPADVMLEPNTIVQPDVFVVPAGQISAGSRDWRELTSLHLAVEVLSDGSHRHDRVRKRRYYQRNGVPEYWIVDLDSRLVERWRPDDLRPEILTDVLAWQCRPDVPPLTLDLPALFEEACGPVPPFVPPAPRPSAPDGA